MAINARGDQASLIGRRQADFKTPEAASAAGFVPLPFYSLSISETEEQNRDEALVGDAFGGDIVDGLRRMSGSLEVPMAAGSFGWHLALLLGLPATSGAGPDYTHVFKTAATQVPLFATLGLAHNDIAVFRALEGQTYNGMSISSAKEGARQRASFDVIGYSETDPGAVLDATPVDWLGAQIPVKFTGQVLKDTVLQTTITGVDLNVAKGLEPDQETMNASAYAEDILSGMWAISGSITTRFRDRTWIDIADAGTLFDLGLKWTISATVEISMVVHNVRLEKSTPAIEGAGIISQQFNFANSRPDPGEFPFTVTLKNQQADYANP